MSTFGFTALYKIGFVDFSVPGDVLQSLKSSAHKHIESDFKSLAPYNENLIGLLSNEYHYPEAADILLPTLQQAAQRYYEEYNDGTAHTEYIGPHKDVWINFQKKNEYNPPHNHQGDLSFVIWVDIPFDREQELAHFKRLNTRAAERNAPGSFNFLMPNPTQSDLGGILLCNIPLDKSYEGKGVMFHSSVVHMVYPFLLSDGRRISIAGNLSVRGQT